MSEITKVSKYKKGEMVRACIKQVTNTPSVIPHAFKKNMESIKDINAMEEKTQNRHFRLW